MNYAIVHIRICFCARAHVRPVYAYNTSVGCLTRELVIFSNRRNNETQSVYTHTHAVTMKLPPLGPLLWLLLQLQSPVGGQTENCVRPGKIRTPVVGLPEALFMVQCHLSCIGKVCMSELYLL